MTENNMNPSNETPTPRAQLGDERCQHLSNGRLCSGVKGHTGVHTLWKQSPTVALVSDDGGWVAIANWRDDEGRIFVPTAHSNVPVRNEEIARDLPFTPSDPTGEARKSYMPSEPRNIVDVLTKMIEKIPSIPHDPRSKGARDPATEVWRTETLREALKRLKADAEYAPPEAHQHHWMRGATLMKEHFPDHLIMNVMVNGQRIDAGTLKRNGQRIPDAATDTWERAVMRVWIPNHFAPGGRWHLTTNSGADQ